MSSASRRAFFVLSDGKLRRRENTLVFENASVRKTVPVESVGELFVLGEVALNASFLKLLAEHGVVMHLFNRYGFYCGSFVPREPYASGFLLVKQVEHYLEPGKRLYLAKSFVAGAVSNLGTVYGLETGEALEKLKRAETVEQVMSVEAEFRKLSYRRLEEETGMELERRTRRPPKNPLNALISFGNSLLYAKLLGEIYYTALNPTVSYLHEPSEKRFSLALDASEVFKPIFVDRLIVKLVKEGKLRPEHFRSELEAVYLSDAGKRVFLEAFNGLLEATVRHRKLKRKVSYRKLMRLELYKLVKHLLGEEAYLPFEIRRGW